MPCQHQPTAVSSQETVLPFSFRIPVQCLLYPVYPVLPLSGELPLAIWNRPGSDITVEYADDRQVLYSIGYDGSEPEELLSTVVPL